MFFKWMTALKIVAAVMAVCIIGCFSGLIYLSDYCTDEVPDTTSLFVYTVDKGIDDLNRKYLDGKKIKVSDERYIVFEDIPEIVSLNGVDSVYIMDDAVINPFLDGIRNGEITEAYVAVPSDIMKYYGDPSGMRSVFRIGPEKIPGDSEYVFIRYSDKKAEIVSDPGSSDVYQFFYKYDESTWNDFTDRLNDYLIEYDAISDVNMLITTSGSSDDAAVLQDRLMKKYPGSNYLSAEFSRVFRNEQNKIFWLKVIIFAVIVIAVTIVIEIVLGAVVKRVRVSKK